MRVHMDIGGHQKLSFNNIFKLVSEKKIKMNLKNAGFVKVCEVRGHKLVVLKFVHFSIRYIFSGLFSVMFLKHSVLIT